MVKQIIDGVEIVNVGVSDDVTLPIGTDGTTYFKYDSASSKLQLYVNNVKRGEWR